MPTTKEIEAGRAFVRLFLKDDMKSQLLRTLRIAEHRLREFGRSAKQIGREIATAGLAAVAPFVYSTRTFAAFDDAMREVAAVTQAVGEDFKELTIEAKRLGASTSYTASQVALLMAELGRAGFSAQQIKPMTGAVLSLARATKTEGAQAAGIMAATIRQFALNAEDAARVADVLTIGANKSFNTLETLGESLAYAGPVAKDFNMSLEDTVAVLGTLGNVGIQGSAAGTTLRRILLATGAEAKKLKRIFGVEFVDAAGNARPLVDTLDEIAEVTRDLGTAERAAKFQEAFGVRGITGASAVGRNITGTRALRKAIAEAGGSAETTAKMMDAGLGGALRILWSAIEGVQIAIGEALSPTLSKFAKLMTATAQTVIRFIKANKGIIVAAAAVAAAIITTGVALIGLGAFASLASMGIGVLATTLSVVLSPIGLLLTALTGGIAAWLKFTESGQQAAAALGRAFGGIKDALMSGDWELAGKIAVTGLKLAILHGLKGIQEAFPRTFASVLHGIGRIGDGIVSVWGKVTAFLKEQWNSWGKNVVETAAFAASHMKQVWQEAVQGLANWMLRKSAEGGVFGKIMSKILGVDMSEVQKERARLDRELGLSGQQSALAEAQEAVRQYVEQLEIAAEGLDIDAGTGKVSEGLEQFLDKLESGTAIEDVADELAKLREEAAKQRAEATKAEAKGGVGGVGGGVGGGVLAAATAPRGVALTATYSAAAARISGYQPGGGAQERTAKGVDNLNKIGTDILRAVLQFVAGWKVH